MEKKYKEKEDLVLDDLNKLEEGYTRCDIVDMIEIGNMLANRNEMARFNDMLEFCNDGVNTFGLFVKFCYDIYCQYNYEDISSFLNYELDKCLDAFIMKYYEEEVVVEVQKDSAKEFLIQVLKENTYYEEKAKQLTDKQIEEMVENILSYREFWEMIYENLDDELIRNEMKKRRE